MLMKVKTFMVEGTQDYSGKEVSCPDLWYQVPYLVLNGTVRGDYLRLASTWHTKPFIQVPIWPKKVAQAKQKSNTTETDLKFECTIKSDAIY